MKKLKCLGLAFLVASLLAIPAAAQGKKGTRNNNGTGAPKQTSQARADEVQDENHKPLKGSKSEGKKTRKGWTHSHHRGRK